MTSITEQNEVKYAKYHTFPHLFDKVRPKNGLRGAITQTGTESHGYLSNIAILR